MASWTQHHFELDFALQHASWRPAERVGYAGWQAGASRDPFNRLATYPDEVGDWLWHKEPWSGAALCWGLERTRESLARGDLRAGALKLALLSHYCIDPLAVSHAWLELLGEIEDFADAPSLMAFHDPVENLPADVVATAAPIGRDEPFGRLYVPARTRAYALGTQTFDTFFARGAQACWPLVVAGIENSAPVALALAEAAAEPEPSQALDGLERLDPEYVEAATRDWVLRDIFEAPDADAILSRLADPSHKAALQERQGWQGSDLFFAPDRCTRHARSVYARWRSDRDAWLASQAGPRPAACRPEKITADWRPD